MISIKICFYKMTTYICMSEIGLEIDNIVLTKLDQLDNKNTITEKQHHLVNEIIFSLVIYILDIIDFITDLLSM